MKVSELKDAELDKWVAKAEEILVHIEDDICIRDDVQTDHGEEPGIFIYDPSTSWEDGGPIIFREEISLYVCENFGPTALIKSYLEGDNYPELWILHGDTYLIAAMRAYVASKYGDEVEDE